MNENKSNKTKWGVAAIVTLVLLALMFALVRISWPSTTITLDPATPPTASAPDPALVDLLTVDTVTEQCATSIDQNVVMYDVGALKSVPPRKWSDALSTPLGNEGLAGIEQAICNDPLYGVTVANMLAGLSIDGVSVGSLNSWLSPFGGDVSNINDWAALYIPLLDVAQPSNEQLQEAVDRNRDWQWVAARLNTLLSRFKVVGIETLKSVKNWHLAAGGLVTGGLPEVELDPRQDAKKALVLQVTLKNACVPLRIGFNLGDKRPEVFKPPVCKTPTPPPHKVPPPSKPPKVPPTPTPTPTPEPTPTPTPPGPSPTPTPTPTPTPPGPAPTPPPPPSTCVVCPKVTPSPGPTPPAYVAPSPIGTMAVPTQPAAPDPAPPGGVHDVNPPAVPAQPNSGSGATNTTSPAPSPSPPAGNPGTSSGDAGSSG